MLTVFTACGTSVEHNALDKDFPSVENSLNDSFLNSGSSINKNEHITEDSSTPEKPQSENDKTASTNRKIIEKIYLDIQTKEFEELIEKLNKEIKTTGGYIENSRMSGNSYEDYCYDENSYYSPNFRTAEFIIRIPSSKSEKFTTYISEIGTVTNKEIDTEDVTLSYVDIESRIKALNIEKQSLENLLAKASTVNDIIAIQDRLTDVIYEIEKQQSQLRTYDNLIEYTTITVNIREVDRVDIVEEQSMWEEIKHNLLVNIENIGYGIKDLIVGIISIMPYLIIYACIGIVFILVIKKIKKKRKLKKEKKEKAEIKK